jgi:hypothetical protein
LGVTSGESIVRVAELRQAYSLLLDRGRDSLRQPDQNATLTAGNEAMIWRS